jgi:hypothetical protein
VRIKLTTGHDLTSDQDLLHAPLPRRLNKHCRLGRCDGEALEVQDVGDAFELHVGPDGLRRVDRNERAGARRVEPDGLMQGDVLMLRRRSLVLGHGENGTSRHRPWGDSGAGDDVAVPPEVTATPGELEERHSPRSGRAACAQECVYRDIKKPRPDSRLTAV